MKEFELDARHRLRLRLAGDGPFLVTPEGERYVDPRIMSPGVSNVLRLARLFCQGDGLDVGSSYFGDNQSNGLPGATPVDRAIAGSGDALALVQADASQDFVFASHIYEHLDDPELAVAEARRVLRPGGKLFVYSPFPGHPVWDPALNPGMLSERDGHRWQPSPGSVSRLLVVGGFELVYVEHEADHLHSFVVVGRKTS